MKSLINILIAAIMLVAVISATWAGTRTGNYWGIPIVLVAAFLYWFGEWPARQSSTISALQYGITRILAGLVFSGLGAFGIWLGLAEISAPVTFAFIPTRIILGFIRDTAGSIWITLILWWFGGTLMVSGYRLLKPLTLRSRGTR
ncbi:MAG: hypothetical protein V4443_06435 [Pseudomonadota bacterium]